MAILESPSACIAAEEGVIAKAVLMPATLCGRNS